jgi:hypothetical protein
MASCVQELPLLCANTLPRPARDRTALRFGAQLSAPFTGGQDGEGCSCASWPAARRSEHSVAPKRHHQHVAVRWRRGILCLHRRDTVEDAAVVDQRGVLRLLRRITDPSLCGVYPTMPGQQRIPQPGKDAELTTDS